MTLKSLMTINGKSVINFNLTTEMFIFKLWRGEYSLVKTYWFFSVLITLVLSIPTSIYSMLTVEAQLAIRYFYYIYLFLFASYIVICSVGLWRSASSYTKNFLWKLLAKTISIINIFIVIIYLTFFLFTLLGLNTKKSDDLQLNKPKVSNNTKSDNLVNIEDAKLAPQNQVYKLVGTVKNELGISQFLIDFNNILRTGNTVKVWEKTNYSLQQVSSNGLYKSKRVFSEYDCSAGTRKTLSASEFEEIDFQGRIISHREDWKDFPPIPANSGVLKIICSK